MKTTKIQNQSRPTTARQEIPKILEEIEMKLHITTSTIKIRVSKVLASKAPARLLGGLAMGAMLMTATALPLNTIHADETSRPLAIISYDQQIGGLLEMESGFNTPAKVAVASYDQQISDLLEMESGFNSPAKVVRSSYGRQMADLLEIESTFNTPAKVVRSSYGQQMTDLNS